MAKLTNEHIMAMARHETAVRNAFAACKRAFTMCEPLLEFACICGMTTPGDGTPNTPKTCPAHQADAACKAARTAMRKAQEADDG